MRSGAEILIVGGGAAGIAAAVAASRAGAKVTLLERNAYPGGKATAAEVGTVCGLYHFSKDPVSRFAVDGFAKEFSLELARRSGTLPQSNSAGLHYLPYIPTVFRQLSEELLHQHKVSVYYNASLSGVRVGEKIEGVEAVCDDGQILISPAAVIDCSGDSIVSALAGAELIESDEYQAAAQVWTIENIRADDEPLLGMQLIKCIRQGIEDGHLHDTDDRISVVPGSLRNNSVMLKAGIAMPVTNAPGIYSELEIKARAMVKRISEYLFAHTAVFTDAGIGHIADEVGTRTGRRAVGKYILTENDVLTCKRSEDDIAIGAWPVEEWGQDKRVRMTWLPENDYYTIPRGCLMSASIDNLYFAGRTISASEKAIASARVIGICLQTGYAAGKLAVERL